MSDTATIRKVTGGYIVTVRWPYAGSPLSGGEMVCTSFDEAITALHRHLHTDEKVCLRVGESLVTEKRGSHD